MVAGGQRHQGLQLGDQGSVDTGRADMAGTAMDDPMTDRPKAEIRQSSEASEEPLYDGREIARGRHILCEVEVARNRQVRGATDPGDVHAPDGGILAIPE
ncbi:hypothetical protein OICFNHDK_0507 [Methylobacterium bullatum]|uniref:Uncharacterized protein n=1 Tax=Methylobacterium bullatum TaxID=570505 RepID=A0AAV4Z2Q7_9HYPH|nr:hypothetical protein OICFNHDK_0507 [Methylobacterium bullatum]